MLQRPVAHEALQLTDSHRLALDAKNARALTLRLLRTYTTTDRRQRAIYVDSICCSADIALAEVVDKGWDIDIYRAGSNATRIFAI
jgi:hypothetical protein